MASGLQLTSEHEIRSKPRLVWKLRTDAKGSDLLLLCDGMSLCLRRGRNPFCFPRTVQFISPTSQHILFLFIAVQSKRWSLPASTVQFTVLVVAILQNFIHEAVQ